MKPFTFNRAIVLASFAETEKQKEAEKSEYYKRRNAGLLAWNNRLKNQLSNKNK